MQKLDSKLIALEDERRLYQETFSTEPGKKVLDRLKRACYYNQSTYNEQNSQESVLFREGKRAVILHIINMLDDKVFEHIRNKMLEQQTKE